MNRRHRLALLCAAIPLIGAAGAAMLMAQDTSPAPARSVEVNGWRVEDVPEPTEDDPQHRVIRMTRGGEYEDLVFTVDLSGYRLEGWGDNSFSANGAHEGRSCSSGGGVMAETGPPEERAARVRAVLARELGNLERQCGAPRGTMQGRLEGFEGGFAQLSAWYGERQAQARLIAEESNSMEVYGENVAYDDGGYSLDTNMYETYPDDGNMMTSETNYSEDPEATAAAIEAAEAALNAVAGAAEAADPGPK